MSLNKPLGFFSKKRIILEGRANVWKKYFACSFILTNLIVSINKFLFFIRKTYCKKA